MSTRKSNFGCQYWFGCDIIFWFIMTLYCKMRQILLQNATKVYYKMRQFYHKMRQLLQNATIVLQKRQSMQNATFITKFIDITNI